jgi:hypothetical protein
MCLNAAAAGGLTSFAGVVSQYSAGQAKAAAQRQLASAQANAYEAAARISDQNAAISGRQAENTVDRGALALQALKQKARAVYAAQRAGYSANGLATTEGSPADVLDDTELQYLMDADALRSNIQWEKWGFDVQGTNYRNQAAMHRGAAANAIWSGEVGAAFSEYEARQSLFSGIAGLGTSMMQAKTGSGMTVESGNGGKNYYNQWQSPRNADLYRSNELQTIWQPPQNGGIGDSQGWQPMTYNPRNARLYRKTNLWGN